MTVIPTLETERLRLRPMTIEDWPAYEQLMQSERSQFMGGPTPKHVTWGIFSHDIAHWVLFGHGALMIDDKTTGKTVGQVGLNHGPLFPEHELGWFLYEGFEGHGYALEAAQTMRKWAFDRLSLKTLVSYIDPKNDRSRKLAERMGAVIDPDAQRHDPVDLVYRHPLS
ncbi:Protein N-acetyltransferase, RimJ/RimL family [Pseudovibrio ascidiaceicola]|uniref:Protein N-acetyltransferase, RimJ/RimL family n=1 Tax=Pseudovibrio ascidiaceicola TaxID=285279 RepID=A0A1I3ZY01_9HYPH|nr:GNAT family N-acetyltransferase [Pseudovibrio ascidiaceicola]SFK48561.1 Protein N-acetyltransferase, RimJ/RimL family [Pseudovibrio ascidiaceicola]